MYSEHSEASRIFKQGGMYKRGCLAGNLDSKTRGNGGRQVNKREWQA